jgi:hypothetical protein
MEVHPQGNDADKRKIADFPAGDRPLPVFPRHSVCAIRAAGPWPDDPEERPI